MGAPAFDAAAARTTDSDLDETPAPDPSPAVGAADVGIQGSVELFGRDVKIDTALFYRPRVVHENVEPAKTFHRVRGQAPAEAFCMHAPAGSCMTRSKASMRRRRSNRWHVGCSAGAGAMHLSTFKPFQQLRLSLTSTAGQLGLPHLCHGKDDRTQPAMPEGPSIVILREQAAHLTHMRITRASGNTRLDTQRLIGQTIVALRSWGKHFLVEFENFSLRVHFLLFGSYRIDERREDMTPRLSLGGSQGELNLYACSLRWIEAPLDAVYDWRTDVMSDQWSAVRARKKLLERPKLLACDALLDQEIFAGVGNIIKNEVLFRIRVHPLSEIGALPAAQRSALVREARTYAFEFLAWKKAYVLKKHWLVHTRQICPRCNIPLQKAKLGTTQRRSFFCNQCQVLYTRSQQTVGQVSRSTPIKAAAAARRKTTPRASRDA